jgi:hypothetical protein
MSILKEKSQERLNASWLNHPVTKHAAARGNPLGGRRDGTAFWLTGGFSCGDTEPLPSMFTSKTNAARTELRPAKAHLDRLTSLAAKLPKWHISKRTASYIIASFLLLFAALDGVLLTASSSSADRRAPIEQAAAALDRDGTETAMMISAPSFEAAEGSQAPSFAAAPGASPGGEPWSAAVVALEQLLAQQKASQTAAMKHAENERLLKRLENWVNARTQKPAVLAAGCVAPAGRCWKGVMQIQ